MASIKQDAPGSSFPNTLQNPTLLNNRITQSMKTVRNNVTRTQVTEEVFEFPILPMTSAYEQRTLRLLSNIESPSQHLTRVRPTTYRLGYVNGHTPNQWTPRSNRIYTRINVSFLHSPKAVPQVRFTTGR